MPEKIEQELSFERLVSGDRPSVMALGVFGAESLKRQKIAIFMVDVLGRVCLMPANSVQVLHPPIVREEELNTMTEEEAINVLLAQGSPEADVIRYLKDRNSRETVNG